MFNKKIFYFLILTIVIISVIFLFNENANLSPKEFVEYIEPDNSDIYYLESSSVEEVSDVVKPLYSKDRFVGSENKLSYNSETNIEIPDRASDQYIILLRPEVNSEDTDELYSA